MDNPDPSVMPVASKVCNQCLLSSFPLVDELRRHQILKDCAETGRTFLCHKATMIGQYVVCRGFYNKDLSLAVVLAKALDRVEFVEVQHDS